MRARRKSSGPKSSIYVLSSFTETASQLVSRRERWDPENNAQIVSKANYDTEKLRPHVKIADDCERLLECRADKAFAEEGMAETILRAGSASSVSGAVLYRENVLGAVRKQMTTGFSQN